MTIYGADGFTPIAGVHGFTPNETPPAAPVLEGRRDLEPGPGYAVVLRDAVATHTEGGLAKPVERIEFEEHFNIRAVVARIGPARKDEAAAWFSEGDEVIITPSLLTRIDVGPNDPMWIIPFAGVKARFVSNDGVSAVSYYGVPLPKSEFRDKL